MAKSLEDQLRAAKSPVDMLRNSQVGPNVYPGVKAEYTNWRDEQMACRNRRAVQPVLPHGGSRRWKGRTR